MKLNAGCGAFATTGLMDANPAQPGKQRIAEQTVASLNKAIKRLWQSRLKLKHYSKVPGCFPSNSYKNSPKYPAYCDEFILLCGLLITQSQNIRLQ